MQGEGGNLGLRRCETESSGFALGCWKVTSTFTKQVFNFLKKNISRHVSASLFGSFTISGTHSQSGCCLFTGSDIVCFHSHSLNGGGTKSKTNSICCLKVREEVYRAMESTYSQCRVQRSILPLHGIGIVTVSPTAVVLCCPA